jgi:two-component system, OmpR family, KDP operon response regulator KdpE
MRKFTVLIVDDEERILNFLKIKLKASGYGILTATSGPDALEMAKSEDIDLVVLDVLMPKMTGFEMLKELRTFSSVPVIILSAKGEAADKVKGLNLGADDYLPKPFNPDELLARLEALRRRLESSEQRKKIEIVTHGDITIDHAKHEVYRNKQLITLTRIEWLLLNELINNVGRLMTYDVLLTRVWGPEYRDDVQLLRAWMSRLRNKIESDPEKPKLIRTVTKTGYTIDEPGPPS